MKYKLPVIAAAAASCALLSACQGVKLPELPGFGATTAATAVPAGTGGPAPAGTVAAASPGAPGAAQAPALDVSPDEVKAMIIRSDPKACSATSDASSMEIAATYGKLGLQFGAGLVVSKVTDDASLQKQLDDFKPYLRELSRNTTWLPVNAERLIGDQLYARNGLAAYTPPARQRALLDKTIMPMFEELKRFAAQELKSPLEFDLRVVRLDQEKAPSVIAGGIVLVPSGMFAALQNRKDAEPIVAFMLAHEFSHALRRHRTKMTQLSLVDSITVASEYKKIASTAGSGFGSLTSLEQMFSFSAQNVKSLMDHTCKSRNWFATMEQNQEFEADVCGALLLKKLGERGGKAYSAADGYARYLAAGLSNQMTPAEEGGCSVKTGHPNPAERMQNLEAYSPAQAAGARH